MKTFPIREGDYYGGSLTVEYADDFDDDDLAEGTVRLRWEAYQGGEVSMEILTEEECGLLSAAFGEVARLLSERSKQIEEERRLHREQMGFDK